ncbi:phosphatase PAP2 family protein [Patulibacter minatonensis]|uniref:phosphatase PAP2 family protein n=1 Tax=Patulibacter minatonensis TaxID=298163 RepID=UPI00047DA1A9|nr:phosphatase PAP2 family protein [Patulibacter minatonensis]
MAWPLLAGLGAAFALLAYEKRVGPIPGERWVLEHWVPWPQRPHPITDVVAFCNVLGTPLFAAALVAATAWLLGRSLGRRAVALVVIACAGVAFNGVLKTVIGPTPLWAEARGGAGVAGDNFPSGHVVYATVLAGALGVLAWERRRTDLVLFAVIAIVVMGPARVLEGAHLTSDVIAGYLVGAGWLVAAVRLTGHGRRVDAGERGSAAVDAIPRRPAGATRD